MEFYLPTISLNKKETQITTESSSKCVINPLGIILSRCVIFSGSKTSLLYACSKCPTMGFQLLPYLGFQRLFY